MLFILIFIAFFFLFFFVSTIFFRPSSFSILLFFLLYSCYLLVSTFLICTTQSVQCEQRRIKHAQVFSTAQYNGWLAASQLGLRKCVKLAAAAAAIQFQQLNVLQSMWHLLQKLHYVVLNLSTKKILQLFVLDGSWRLIKIVTGPAERLTSMTVHTHIEILLGN